MTRSLWQISDDLRALADRLIEAGGELTAEDEATLAAISTEMEQKVERIGHVVRELRLDGAAAKSEADRLGDMARRREAGASRLEEYIRQMMIAAGVKRIDTPTISVRRQQNGQPSIRWVGDPEAIPDELVIERREFAASKVRELLAANAPIPDGVVVERGEHLRGLK